MEEIREQYDGRINYVVRYFPHQGHFNSMNAAVAVEAAAQQGHGDGAGPGAPPDPLGHQSWGMWPESTQSRNSLRSPVSPSRPPRPTTSGANCGSSFTPLKRDMKLPGTVSE